MITGTFLDEISHDIPHQNWSRFEWNEDFKYMKAIGIQRVILIRCGYRHWLTYPSKVLVAQNNCFTPSEDLVQMFLDLAAAHQLEFYFGTYDSGHFWDTDGDVSKDYDLNRAVIEEVWQRYGHHPAFKGWYLSLELSRQRHESIEKYQKMGLFCKAISNQLPVLMSPYMDGKKAVLAHSNQLAKPIGVSLAQHERAWNQIFAGLKGGVDIVAFQDGHVDFEELPDFLRLNKQLADQHNLICWTNSESFDRDMPLKFMPIKWEKLRLKLQAAQSAGITEAITFEFSHFMSPQSAYRQAGHLYNRYKDFLSTVSTK